MHVNWLRCAMSGIQCKIVSKIENQRFLSKFDSVGLKLHQISLKKIARVHNIYSIVLQCYVYLFKVLCCNRRRNVLAVFVTECHSDVQTMRMSISAL